MEIIPYHEAQAYKSRKKKKGTALTRFQDSVMTWTMLGCRVARSVQVAVEITKPPRQLISTAIHCFADFKPRVILTGRR